MGTLDPGVEVKICDPRIDRSLGPNLLGELYMRRGQVTRGYLNNEKANEESFTSDGFYKTGDACLYDENGLLYILDRYKEVIKVDTQQVPPAQLESLLLSHQSVAEAAVVGIPHEVHGE